MAARITPGFQEVRRRNLPLAALGRLVVELREVDARQHLVEGRREVQVDRCGVDRVTTEDQQQVDLAGGHVGRQRAERLDLIDRLGFRSLRVDDRLPDVTECLVHRMRERMNDRRLCIARDNEAGAAVRLEVLRHGGRELRNLGGTARR